MFRLLVAPVKTFVQSPRILLLDVLCRGNCAEPRKYPLNNDLALPRYLVSLIRKLSHLQSISQGILHVDKAYIEISPSLCHWVGSKLTKLTLKVPHGNVSKFLFLRDLKYGYDDGRVWLACCSSSFGNLYVVKFLREVAHE